MKTILFLLLINIVSLGLLHPKAFAHCEIPCGIYNDEMRISLIREHIETIEKSMKMIQELTKEGEKNYNQLVRWVSNKESHATQIQHIVSQYFMTQRIKPDQAKYTEKLTLLHQMLLAAMKCKQTTEVSHVNDLRTLLKKFEILYFGHSTN